VPGQPGSQQPGGPNGVAVYGAAAAAQAHAAAAAAQANGQRARSVSPHEVNATSLSDHPRANSRGGILYAELQFPVTSNYGSMKKRSQRDRVQDPRGDPGVHPGSMSGNTTATTSVNSGEPVLHTWALKPWEAWTVYIDMCPIMYPLSVPEKRLFEQQQRHLK